MMREPYSATGGRRCGTKALASATMLSTKRIASSDFRFAQIITRNTTLSRTSRDKISSISLPHVETLRCEVHLNGLCDKMAQTSLTFLDDAGDRDVAPDQDG